MGAFNPGRTSYVELSWLPNGCPGLYSDPYHSGIHLSLTVNSFIKK